jgi:hypothetical protein
MAYTNNCRLELWLLITGFDVLALGWKGILDQTGLAFAITCYVVGHFVVFFVR